MKKTNIKRRLIQCSLFYRFFFYILLFSRISAEQLQPKLFLLLLLCPFYHASAYSCSPFKSSSTKWMASFTSFPFFDLRNGILLPEKKSSFYFLCVSIHEAAAQHFFCSLSSGVLPLPDYSFRLHHLFFYILSLVLVEVKSFFSSLFFRLVFLFSVLFLFLVEKPAEIALKKATTEIVKLIRALLSSTKWN